MLLYLDKRRLRLLLSSMQQAVELSSLHCHQHHSSSPSQPQHVLCVSSIALRDDLLIASLHAGYSAVFRPVAGNDRWLLSYGDGEERAPCPRSAH